MNKIERDFECKVEHKYNEEKGAPEMKITLPEEFKRIMDLYVVRGDATNYKRPVLDVNGDIKEEIRQRYLIKARLKTSFKSISNGDFWAGVLYDKDEYDTTLTRFVPIEDIVSFHSLSSEFASMVGKITTKAVEDTMHFTISVKEEKET